MKAGEELMELGADLKGVSSTSIGSAICAYLLKRDLIRKDASRVEAISLFLDRWLRANQSTEEAQRLKELIDKHFGSELLNKLKK